MPSTSKPKRRNKLAVRKGGVALRLVDEDDNQGVNEEVIQVHAVDQGVNEEVNAAENGDEGVNEEVNDAENGDDAGGNGVVAGGNGKEPVFHEGNAGKLLRESLAEVEGAINEILGDDNGDDTENEPVFHEGNADDVVPDMIQIDSDQLMLLLEAGYTMEEIKSSKGIQVMQDNMTPVEMVG